MEGRNERLKLPDLSDPRKNLGESVRVLLESDGVGVVRKHELQIVLERLLDVGYWEMSPGWFRERSV